MSWSHAGQSPPARSRQGSLERTLWLRASRMPLRSWKIIHFFSISLRNGRVLQGRWSAAQSLLERLIHMAHAPYPVVQTARDELTQHVSSAFSFEERLVAVHIRDICKTRAFVWPYSHINTARKIRQGSFTHSQAVWCNS